MELAVKSGPPPGLVKAGIWLGCKAGFWAVIAYLSGYAVATLALVLADVARLAPGSDYTYVTVTSTVTVVVLIYFVGCIYGLLPAILIGALTGGLTGQALALTWKSMTAVRVWIVGSLVCLLIALLVNTLAWSLFFPVVLDELNLFSDPGYIPLLGIPSLIYLSIGGWVSARLYSKMRRAQAARLVNEPHEAR
jgi:hypothetical protein